MSNLRLDADYVLVDVDASPSQAGGAHAKPEDMRFGLYGALAHPIEANAHRRLPRRHGPGCAAADRPDTRPAHRAQCVWARCATSLRCAACTSYSPHDRIAGTTVAYPAAFPVGVLPTNENDTGLVIKTTSVDAFRADGTQLDPTALGDPAAFTGNGYMLLGLEIAGLASRYRDDSARRGGPLMVLAAPTLPGRGLSHACSSTARRCWCCPTPRWTPCTVRASLCTQGEINAALLYATVSLVGTHAALWTTP